MFSYTMAFSPWNQEANPWPSFIARYSDILTRFQCPLSQVFLFHLIRNLHFCVRETEGDCCLSWFFFLFIVFCLTLFSFGFQYIICQLLFCFYYLLKLFLVLLHDTLSFPEFFCPGLSTIFQFVAFILFLFIFNFSRNFLDRFTDVAAFFNPLLFLTTPNRDMFGAEF